MSDALQRLIDAVEAGVRPTIAIKGEAGLSLWTLTIDLAFKGSLDHARALHARLLPGAKQAAVDWGPSGCGAKVYCWPDGLSGVRELMASGYDECPARALLAAILRAYQQVQQ